MNKNGSVGDRRFYMYTAKLTRLKRDVAICGINYMLLDTEDIIYQSHYIKCVMTIMHIEDVLLNPDCEQYMFSGPVLELYTCLSSIIHI